MQIRTLTIPSPKVDPRALAGVKQVYRHTLMRARSQIGLVHQTLSVPAPTTRRRVPVEQ